MNGNKFVDIMLHTPLRVFMGETMLITVTGRKTGRHYRTPVGYFQDRGYLWVLSSRDRTWWRNLQGGATVELFLNGHEACGFAEPVLEEGAVAERLAAYLKHMPLAARGLGVHLENGLPNSDDLSSLSRERLFIRIKLLP